MKKFLNLFNLVAAVTVPKSTVLFEDNFETLDFSKWQHEQTLSGGGNWEFQYYTNNRSNSYVHDNTLFLKPTFMSEYTSVGESFLSSGQLSIYGGDEANYCTSNDYYGCSRTGTPSNYLNPIISAKVRTMKSFSFKFGKVSFDAKMPKGDWLWPAVWLLPKYDQYGSWPSSGEIDILESRGNVYQTCDNHRVDSSCVASTLHWGPRYEYNRYYQTTKEVCGVDYSADFHNYKLEWTPQTLKTFVDDTLLLNIDMHGNSFWNFGNFPSGLDNPWKYGTNMAPFDSEFYLIINLAIGGTNGYFPDGCSNQYGNKPWSNSSPTAPKDFWTAKNDWSQTWDMSGEDSAFQIKNLVVSSLD